MLAKVCAQCPEKQDCIDNGACIHETIEQILGSGVTELTEIADFDTEYTDSANITDTILPHIPDSFDEDPPEES